MPRPKSIIPTYRLHKATGQAVAYVNRREVYLGSHGSPESRKAYSELLERLQKGETAKTPKPSSRPPAFALNDLFIRFAVEELPKYSRAEQRCLRGAIRTARDLFGETVISEFGPLKLRAVRDAMIEKGWSRSYINKQVKRLRKILRWGVGWELVPHTLADSLRAVESLEAGDTDAPESVPRSAVPAENIQAMRPFLTERYRDIVDLMLLTGCRPGEIIDLTVGEIDRSGDIWRVSLRKHKTAHHGKSRTIFFNAKAQLILRKYLQADPAARLFCTRGDRLSASLKAACVKAGVPVFTPHWLRHTVATKIADEMGTEAAQRLLGHSQAAMTRHYSQGAEKQAIDAVKRLG